jgi:hypothetical protein
MAADDGKRTEMVCTKVTERMALDLLRDASIDDRSVSDFIYRLLRHHLYGSVSRREANNQATRFDKVDHDSR